ncbi:MAG TPA: ABC transporter permease [Candidatus Limnocylindrales bacterium]|nr:ABC transporter permease [Candidatus Limnocylindrales bacterium]
MATATEAVAAPTRPRAGGWSKLPVWMRRAILVGALVGGWQAYVSFSEFGGNPLLFASPADTGEAFLDGWRDGSLARATWETLRILLMGVGIGIVFAAGFTLFATLSQIGDDILTLLTAILNPLPGVAVLPLALLWFGLSTNAILFAIANATIWPIAINLTTGFKTVNPTIVAAGRNIGLSGVRLATDVLAPAALPSAITGLKTAWAFGWRTVVAAELVFGVVGGEGGLGTYINNAKLYLFTPQMFAALLTIAVLGVAFELLFGMLERRTIVRWGMQRS